MKGEIFCPFCNRTIVAVNKAEVATGEHDAYVFVHDDVEHPDDFTQDEAMYSGIQ